MTGLVPQIAGEPVKRIDADVRALFAHTAELLGGDVPEPAVTLDLPASDPEPLHVFTLTNAHDFEVAGFLTGGVVRLAFDVDVVCVATSDTVEEAARIANAYQSLLMQVTLCDGDLGGTVQEVGAPQVADYRTWEDQDGRRHAGYRLTFNMTKDVAASAAAARIIEGQNDEAQTTEGSVIP